MKMKALILNVYDDDDKIIKTAEAKLIDLRFGTIRSLMEMLNIEDVNDTSELLKKVYAAWNQLTKILERVFPEIEGDDWDGVKLSELMPIIILILKSSFVHLMQIPTDKEKN